MTGEAGGNEALIVAKHLPPASPLQIVVFFFELRDPELAMFGPQLPTLFSYVGAR